MITNCSGGQILGFEQFHATVGVWKRAISEEKAINHDIIFLSAWNHLESGIKMDQKKELD